MCAHVWKHSSVLHGCWQQNDADSYGENWVCLCTLGWLWNGVQSPLAVWFWVARRLLWPYSVVTSMGWGRMTFTNPPSLSSFQGILSAPWVPGWGTIFHFSPRWQMVTVEILALVLQWASSTCQLYSWTVSCKKKTLRPDQIWWCALDQFV